VVYIVLILNFKIGDGIKYVSNILVTERESPTTLVLKPGTVHDPEPVAYTSSPHN
jgi:hypothetical protein